MGNISCAGGVEFDDSRTRPGVAAQLFDRVRIGSMNRGSGKQTIADIGSFNRRHEALGQIIAKRKPESDRQDHRLGDAAGVHLVDQVGDGLGRGLPASPEKLCEGVPA
jgi:hypothetical protein